MPVASYDKKLDILDVDFENLKVKSEADADAAFALIREVYMRDIKHRVYALINYTNFSLDRRLTDYWGSKVKAAVTAYSIVAIRYSVDSLTRTIVKTIAVKAHTPSNMYESREQALAVLQGLRDKSIELVA